MCGVPIPNANMYRIFVNIKIPPNTKRCCNTIKNGVSSTKTDTTRNHIYNNIDINHMHSIFISLWACGTEFSRVSLYSRNRERWRLISLEYKLTRVNSVTHGRLWSILFFHNVFPVIISEITDECQWKCRPHAALSYYQLTQRILWCNSLLLSSTYIC